MKFFKVQPNPSPAMLQDFLIPFLVIGLAELGDKTQLAILCLASKTRKHLQLFLGAMLAFLVTDGLTVLLGEFLTEFIPRRYLKIGAGLLFIMFGLFMLLKKGEEDESCELRKPFLSGFGIVLLSEMGDKTQLAAGLFATQYSPGMVLLGVMAAMAILSWLAVSVARTALKRIHPALVSKIAALLFIAIGALTLLS